MDQVLTYDNPQQHAHHLSAGAAYCRLHGKYPKVTKRGVICMKKAPLGLEEMTMKCAAAGKAVDWDDVGMLRCVKKSCAERRGRIIDTKRGKRCITARMPRPNETVSTKKKRLEQARKCPSGFKPRGVYNPRTGYVYTKCYNEHTNSVFGKQRPLKTTDQKIETQEKRKCPDGYTRFVKINKKGTVTSTCISTNGLATTYRKPGVYTRKTNSMKVKKRMERKCKNPERFERIQWRTAKGVVRTKCMPRRSPAPASSIPDKIHPAVLELTQKIFANPQKFVISQPQPHKPAKSRVRRTELNMLTGGLLQPQLSSRRLRR